MPPHDPGPRAVESAGPTDPGAGSRLKQALKARPAAAATTVSAARKVLKRPAAAKAPKAVTTAPAAPAITAGSSGKILGCSKCRWGQYGIEASRLCSVPEVGNEWEAWLQDEHRGPCVSRVLSGPTSSIS